MGRAQFDGWELDSEITHQIDCLVKTAYDPLERWKTIRFLDPYIPWHSAEVSP
jgi:hypothetical protein